MKKLICASLFILIVIFFLAAGENPGNAWETPKVIYPEDNPDSDESVELGAELFFETLLSRDSTISCQTCHMVTEAFADHLPVGVGVNDRKVTRNTPTVLNVGLHPYFMKDGKFATLEEQVLGPINDHREFDLNAEEVIRRLSSIPIYERLSLAAYGEEINIDIVQKALANFQRALMADKSPFDDFMRGETDAISESAKRGWELFQSDRLNCIQCHSGFDFSDYSFQNNGYFEHYVDSGRALITEKREDIGKFKVPTLRNVTVTYPYMHNGSVESLEVIIDQYAAGGSQHENQSKYVSGFSLTSQERKDILEFLRGLTEKRFLEMEQD